MDAGIIVRIKVGHDGQEQTHWGGWSQEEKFPPRLIEGRLREYW